MPALKQKNQNRVTAVTACGTGKTFVALCVAEGEPIEAGFSPSPTPAASAVPLKVSAIRRQPPNRPSANAHRLASSVVDGNFQQAMRHGTVLINGDEVKAQQVANQITLAQAVAEHQLKKIFTFHRNVASARSFTGEGSERIGTHLPEFAALHVNGAMSTAARDGLMTEFKAARRAVMSNARCLTEGIDVPTVDMVAFLTIVGRRRRADRVRRSLGRVAGPARTGRSTRRPHPPDAGRASACIGFPETSSASSASLLTRPDE